MKRKKYIMLAALVVSQVLTFLIVHDGALRLAALFVSVPRAGVSWGITVQLAFWMFASLSLIGAVVGQFLFKERKFAIQCLSLLVFAAFFINIIDDRPYRVSLLLFCGLTGFLVPFLMLRKNLESA